MINSNQTNLKQINWLKYSFIAIAITMLFPLIGAIIELTQNKDLINMETINWPSIRESIYLTIKIGIFAILTAAPIGLTTAFIFNKTNIKYQNLFNIIILVPLVIPRYIGVVIYTDIFGSSGIIPLYGIISDKEIMGGVIIGMLLFPYMHIFITNTLNKISSNIDESALLLNTSKVKYFWSIIIKPCIPAIITSSILIFVYVLNDFGAMQMLGLETISVKIYRQFTFFYNYTNAVLLAMIPLFFTLIISIIDVKIIKKALVKTNTKNNDVYKFKANLITYAFALVPIVIFIFLPLRHIFSLAVVAYNNGLFNSELLHLAMNSFEVAIAVAVIGSFIAFIFSWAKVKDKRSYTKAYPVIYISYATSGIVLGMLWVIVGLEIYPPLYKSIYILIMALTFKYIIHGIKAIEPGVVATTDSIIESSALLGKSKTRTFFSVGIFGNLSVIISGFTLIFINTISDLNITLLLRPIGFNSMATHIFNVQQHAITDYEYAPAAIILIALSLVALVLYGGKRYD